MVGAMDITITHHHYLHIVNDNDKVILAMLDGLRQQINQQGGILVALKESLEQVKADLVATNTSLDNITADIAALDAKIVELSNSPDNQALLDEVVAMSSALKTKTADVAATHPDAPPVVPTT